MPLSAHDVLKLVAEQHRPHEIFEHVSLASVVVAAAAAEVAATSNAGSVSPRVFCGSVVVPDAGEGGGAAVSAGHRRGGGGGGTAAVIPTATVVSRRPSSPPLSRDVGVVVVSSPAQRVPPGHGQLHVCDISESVWSSLGAVTATSAPSQRQFAFTTEAPAFSASHNPSFAWAGDGETPVEASSTTAAVHRDCAEELVSGAGRLSAAGEASLSTSAGSTLAAMVAEGIQLPQLSTPAAYRVAELPTTRSHVAHHTSTGPVITATAGGHNVTQNGTVTVLMWIASSAATAAGDDAAAAAPTSITATTPTQRSRETPRTTSVSAAGGYASPPLCLCVAVRDISDTESTDTDVLTARERRVQMLTLQLLSGAVVYAAKSPADVFAVVSSVSSSHGLTAPAPPRSGTPTAVSLTFHQGGITRCIGVLRRYAPGLTYVCRGGRSSSSLMTLEGAVGGGGGVDKARGGVSRSPSPPARGSSASSLTQPPAQGGAGRHGWRERLVGGGLFLGGASGVGGLLSHYTSNLRSEATAAATTAATAAAAAAAATLRSGGGKEGGKGARHRRGARRRDAPTSPAINAAARDHSSASSFEDLAEEMTAIRLGPCYAPPRPTLPPWRPGEHGGGALTPVTAAEWRDTIAGPRLSPERWCAFRTAVYERGGLANGEVRFAVWCHLLGAHAVDADAAERAAALTAEAALYTRLSGQWRSFLPEQEAHFSAYRDAKHSIVKDVGRTDRTHPAFRDDDSAMLCALRELLLAHVMLDMDLGYSQGMSDVAAVALLVAQEAEGSSAQPASEAAAFLCFRKMLSEHMSTNFVIEERKPGAPYAAVKGLQRKLYQVQVLTRHFHPGLYMHLKTHCMAEDMSFCFRWILVCFKRDLPSLADTMRFWDVLFACPYTTAYEVVVTAALLGAFTQQIMTHLHAYETLLQFMNVLSSGTTVDQVLACARDFYENVCVPETRELRRRLRRQAATAAAIEAVVNARAGGGGDAVAARTTSDAPPGRHVGPQRGTVAPAAPLSLVRSDDDDSTFFPTVEDMVQLFIKTDGPL
ncbi:Rab-GTPase-TBC domain containing protein [Novymonas esmeraldas]|uniref:Rab-GTPase-TBC domain containing protein n=1 Tax=Novymonas esmeraldas TaxID=1808958 RepID=A0AAW0EVP7_9TRYP